MLVRSSIIHTVFAFECAANACLSQLPRAHRFRDQAEKWDPLEKFDLFLLSLPSQPKLPRDNKAVRAMAALIKLRRRYVHSRSQRFPLRLGDDDGQPKITITLTGEHTGAIPPMPLAWDQSHPKQALSDMLSFFRLLFVDLCRYKKPQITMLLSTMLRSSDGYRVADPGRHGMLLKLAAGLELDIEFLGLT